MNLLHETEKELEAAGKTWDSVSFIGSADGAYRCSVEFFKLLANANYDNGYGSAEVAQDLVIVFWDGTWLERYEYDGSEWWEHKSTPWPQSNPRPIEHLFAVQYDSSTAGIQIKWAAQNEVSDGALPQGS